MGTSNLTYNFESWSGLGIVSSILELQIVKIVISKFHNKSEMHNLEEVEPHVF